MISGTSTVSENRESDSAAFLSLWNVILLDVDGTITNGSSIPSESAALVRELSVSGPGDRQVALVTSRGMAELQEFAYQLAALPEPRKPIVVFTSTCTEAYEVSDRVTLLWREMSPAMATFAQQLPKLFAAVGCSDADHHLVDRGAQLTIEFNSWRHLTRFVANCAPLFPDLRFARATFHCLHVLPKQIGKQRAAAFFREQMPSASVLAIGDGFFEFPELNVHGNDIDLLDGHTTCVHVGSARPLRSEILYFPTPRYREGGAARFVARAKVASHRQLLAESKRNHSGLYTAGIVDAVRTMRPEVERFCASLLEFLCEVDVTGGLETSVPRCLAELSRQAEGRKSIFSTLATLLETLPIMMAACSELAFETNRELFVRWLYDRCDGGHESIRELIVRAITTTRDSHVPEELPLYLLQLVPYASSRQIVFVGKDAESSLPPFRVLLRGLRQRRLIDSYREPVGLKIAVERRADGRTTRQLGGASLIRQLAALLSKEEWTRPLSTGQVRRSLERVGGLAPKERMLLDASVGAQLEIYFARATIGDVVTRLADAARSPSYDEYFDVIERLDTQFELAAFEEPLARGERLSLHAHLPPADGSALDTFVRTAIARYREHTGHEELTCRADLRVLLLVEDRLRLELLQRATASAAHPLAPILSIALEDCAAGRLFREPLLFFDTTLATGTTFLFIRLLQSVWGAANESHFGVYYRVSRFPEERPPAELALVVSERVRPSENVVHHFGFYYDSDDRRVVFADRLRELRDVAKADAAVVERLSRSMEATSSRYAAIFERYPLASAIPRGVLFRWWLRRNAIWEMYGMTEIAARQGAHKGRLVEAARRECEGLFAELDAAMPPRELQKIRIGDADAAAMETRDLLETWERKRRSSERRCERAIGKLLGDGEDEIAAYLKAPGREEYARVHASLLPRLQTIDDEMAGRA